MTWPFDPLPPLSFDVIIADPPWLFELRSEAGEGKSAAAHYHLMSLEAIQALPVGQLAQGDCLLLLWTTGWAMATGQAQAVCRAWDFTPVTEIVWRTTTALGKSRVGPGYRARTMHEPILVGKIGSPRQASAFPSIFDGVAREHSRKPEEFYALVDKHTAGLRRADLFARQSRPGFDAWGNEATKFDQEPTHA